MREAYMVLALVTVGAVIVSLAAEGRKAMVAVERPASDEWIKEMRRAS